MRLRLSLAAVAAPITIRRSASSSTTATISCSPATMRRWTISIASDRARRCSDPGAAIFDFADLKSGDRWRLDLSEGRIPWWLFDRKKRVPGTAFGEYLAPLGVFMKGPKATVGDAMACEGPAL